MTDAMQRFEDRSLILGAVAYTKDVVEIWEGMRSYFRDEAGLDLEVALFLNYEAQAEALLGGRIDIGWNTNLAHLQAETWSREATTPLAMRDMDVGWHTHIIAPAGGAVRSAEDLRGRTLALGSRDSGHAAILPVHYLAAEGLVEGKDYQTLRFDLDVGKHGDTGTSERDVYQAVLDGRAAAGAVGSPFWAGLQREGLVPGNAVEVVWTSPAYNHCVFDARPGLPQAAQAAFVEALLAMSWDDPAHREVMAAEGLERCWIAADLSGYDALREAAQVQGFFERGPGARRGP